MYFTALLVKDKSAGARYRAHGNDDAVYVNLSRVASSQRSAIVNLVLQQRFSSVMNSLYSGLVVSLVFMDYESSHITSSILIC